MSRSRKPNIAVEAAKFTGMLGVNASILGYAAFFRKHKVDDIYNKMPEEERRRIYENCPAQKYTSTLSLWSAMEERMMTLNPDMHKYDEPKKPFNPGS